MEKQSDRTLRRTKRKVKKRQQSIAVFTILTMLISAGVVHAQIQGYEIFYQGESLGTVKSASIFEKALGRVEEEYQICFNNDDIVLGEGFEMVSTRIDESMNLEECQQRLNDENIEIYVNGLIVLCDNQVMGTIASSDEAERLATSYKSIYPLANELVFLKQTTRLSKTSDFATILTAIQALKAE